MFFTILFMFALNAFASDIEKAINLYNQKKFMQAFPIIEKEAKKGNSEAQYYLGRMYRWGEGTNINLKRAVYWYDKGAIQKNRKAQNNLGIMYANGLGVKKDPKKAIKLYSLSAAQGTAAAQFNLGNMYRDGEGTEKDYAKALGLYRQAASQGHVRAMHALGLAYQLGMGVPVDKNEAINWYKKAAEKGFTPSIWNLSTLSVPVDNPDDAVRWDETYQWYVLGMKHGDKKDAPFGMGLIYLLGRGNYPRDYPKARELFTMAAENGKADAWYWLGVMQEYGFGGGSNNDKAFELYRKAAAEGSKPAIRRLNQKEPEPAVELIRLIENVFTPQ